MTFDVFTLGESMVRFTPPGYTRLEEAGQLEMRIGGTESNVAIALCRLGLRVAWASRLPRNPLGEFVVRRIRSFGVDVSQVCWAEGERMGLYFIEPGAPPRSSLVLYDRANSAASRMRPEDFDWSILDQARHLHLTGITPAVGDAARATVAHALREARARGRTVSFDVNYRARLWSPEAAAETLTPLLADLDLLVCTREDASIVFGVDGEPEAVARGLGERTAAPWIAVTLGGEGAFLWNRAPGAAAEFSRAEALPLYAVDRVGAGDAFDAGLLWGWLRGEPERGLQYGMVMAALKHTIPGDEFVSSLAEVEAVIRSGHRDIQR